MFKKNILILLSSILFSLTCQGSDTLKLYKSKCGMRYKKYLWNLYYFKAPRSSWSYSCFTKQDIFFNENRSKFNYLIFYNRFGNKLFEGALVSGDMQGEIKHYYNCGRIKRIENYGYEGKDAFDCPFNWSDAPYEKGIWNYYSRHGNLSKTKTYLTLIDEVSGEYYRVINTKFFYRQGRVRKEKSLML